MSLPLAFTVKHDGRSIRLTLTSCKIFMASEYAGNVNLYLACDPSLEPIVQESLHLQIPDEDTTLEFIASGGPDDGVMLVFHSEELALLTDVPESLTFLWCGEPLASIRPELAESVPLEDVRAFVDPLEILGQPRMQTSNLFCLGVERDWTWLLPAFALDTQTKQVRSLHPGLTENFQRIDEGLNVVGGTDSASSGRMEAKGSPHQRKVRLSGTSVRSASSSL